MAEADRSAPVAWLFPGQGSQRKGMGKSLFADYQDLVALTDSILGYSIADLCLVDQDQQLTLTQFAQPAIFVVNALSYYEKLKSSPPPDHFAGHSLGEFNALHAAGAFDFQTGLQLVATRGALMGAAKGGTMAAIIGADADSVEQRIAALGLDHAIDLANINSAKQVVISGTTEAIRVFADSAAKSGFARVVPLTVSGAFHSRFMHDAMTKFEVVLQSAPIRDPDTSVLANFTGTFYRAGEVRNNLARQIGGAVRWRDQMQALRLAGVTQVEQVGPGTVCTDLWREALAEPIDRADKNPASGSIQNSINFAKTRPPTLVLAPTSLSPRQGDAFCRKHGVNYAYVSGSMYRAIASPGLVTAMANAGFLAFLGAGGVSLAEVAQQIATIQRRVGASKPFGVNLIAAPGQPELQKGLVELLIASGVRYAEASGYTSVTPDLIAYRYAGATFDGNHAHCPNRVFAKVSRMEVASAFLSPPQLAVLKKLLAEGRLTPAECAVAAVMPVASDICIEGDSGGHTDGGSIIALLPTALHLRARIAAQNALHEVPLIGAAGGIGSPEAVSACFALGAEFILCGSIHQCTPEAATSDAVKDLLASLGVSDTAYAPAGDMFVTGARVQVAKRGTLFAARANFLYDIYRSYGSLCDVPAAEIQVAERYLGERWQKIWERCRIDLAVRRPLELERIAANEKAKMARVFKSYFTRTMLSALDGELADKVNWQIHSGPAMGAFNSFAESIELGDWRSRNVVTIATELMDRSQRTAEYSWNPARPDA